MGRRVSVDKSHKKSGSLGGEAHQEDARDSRSSSPFYAASASNSSSELTSAVGSREIVRSTSRSSQIDRFDSAAKSLFSSTGRALRKHASKLSLASSISFDKDEEGRVVWKLTGLGAGDQESTHSLASAHTEILKRAISAPYDFKHVTHAYQEQVRGLEKASANELISEFSAIRAGQRADSQLKGIKAQSLSTQSSPPSPDKADAKAEPGETDVNAASPGAPRSAQAQPSLTRSSTASHVHGSRVVENFSRPVSRTLFSPIPPPKRISSLNAFTPLVRVFENAGGTATHVHGPGKHPRRRSRPGRPPASPQAMAPSPRHDPDVVAVGHAISTADDSARHLKASPLPMPPLDLDDVPEDEEGSSQGGSGMSAVGPPHQSILLRQVQSFPSSRNEDVQNGLVPAGSTDVQRHTTSLDDGHTPLRVADCPSDWPVTPSHQSCHGTKRFSIGLKPMCETLHWEDDVDYCYEHAAEAESDFDWDQQAASVPVGLLPSALHSSNAVEPSLDQLQQLAGFRKHDSHEGSVLSMASSIVDISASTHSVGSLPELDYSVNSSRESMDWEMCQPGKRHGQPSRSSHTTSPAKSVKARQGLGLSYSLFPSPPRTP